MLLLKTNRMDEVPAGSLRYLLGNPDLQRNIDDNGIEEGVNGTVG